MVPASLTPTRNVGTVAPDDCFRGLGDAPRASASATPGDRFARNAISARAGPDDPFADWARVR